LTFFAANSRRLNLFERSVKCGGELYFFLVCGCLSGAAGILLEGFSPNSLGRSAT
jgi:hypothetical protein